MKLTLPTLLLTLASLPGYSILYNGSGAGGFGSTVSDSTMDWTDNGSTVSVTFTKGAGDFNDKFVLYLDTGAAGRSSIGTDVNDTADDLRDAISYIGGVGGNTLTFPTAFNASHAIAIDTVFGGLWSIPDTGAVGDNGLTFIKAANSTLSSSTQSSFTFSFDVADVGITPNSGATIDFVATYGNPLGGTQGFWSNEGYGGGFPGSNIGEADFTFTSSESYSIIPEPAMAMLFMSGLGLIYFLRRRK